MFSLGSEILGKHLEKGIILCQRSLREKYAWFLTFKTRNGEKKLMSTLIEEENSNNKCYSELAIFLKREM